MHRFKSAILEKSVKMAVSNLCMKFLAKIILLKYYENNNKKKNIYKMPQGPLNPGFMQEKVQKGDFLKKPLRELKKISCFRFL